MDRRHGAGDDDIGGGVGICLAYSAARLAATPQPCSDRRIAGGGRLSVRILVVGGSSSIGRSVVRAFAARGDAVLATHAHGAASDADEARWRRLDLEAADSFGDFVDGALADLGAPDAAVFLAGALPGKSLGDYSPLLMRQVMEINFTAQADLLARLAPRMADGGRVLMMSSIAGERGSYDPLYAASKAALAGLVKSLAVWDGRLTYNCLAPGLVEGSAMAQAMSEDRRAHHRGASPTGELLRLEDLARIVVDLTGPQWRHLNGTVIRLNGGAYV
jgi:3-oxoacyl-[acyl-carrier protein] reductase